MRERERERERERLKARHGIVYYIEKITNKDKSRKLS